MRLIDADALKETFEIAWKEAWHDREYSNAFFSDGGAVSTEWWCVEDMVDNAPTIEPRQWIPLKDKEPTEDGEYLVSFDDGFVATTGYYDGDFELWADAGEPLAWQPLPEPYKEDES